MARRVRQSGTAILPNGHMLTAAPTLGTWGGGCTAMGREILAEAVVGILSLMAETALAASEVDQLH